MTPDATDPDTDHSHTAESIDSREARDDALADHYGRPDLVETVLEIHQAHGGDPASITRDDIAGIEEFHIQGREATRTLADLAGLAAGDHVLDVGCGIGGPARTLAAEYGCTVEGVDAVADYCRAATDFAERLGLADAVHFQQADARDLPFPDASFDATWLQHVSMNVPDKPTLLAELHRVTRPGGTLALHEITGDGDDVHFPVPWADDPSLSFLVPSDDLRETAERAGFTPRAWRDVTDDSLTWFRGVVEAAESRPDDAPPPLGLNLLVGERASEKVQNVVRNLEEGRIRVVQGVFERA